MGREQETTKIKTNQLIYMENKSQDLQQNPHQQKMGNFYLNKFSFEKLNALAAALLVWITLNNICINYF